MQITEGSGSFGDDVRSLAFDPFSLQQDYLSASKVDVGRSGGGYSRLGRSPSDFQIARHLVVLQQNAVVPRLVANTQFCSASSDRMAPADGAKVVVVQPFARSSET